MKIRHRLGRIRPWWRRFKRNGYRVDRCDECGHRFRWSRDSRHSYSGSSKVWHGPCQALVHARNAARERLTVLGVVTELTGIAADDVRETMSLRAATDGYEASNAWNLAWRVFHDLESAVRKATTP